MHHVGMDPAGSDGIDADTLIPEIDGEGADQPELGGFRGAVGGNHGNPEKGGHGGDEKQVSRAPFLHVTGAFPAEGEGRVKMGLEDGGKLGIIDLGGRFLEVDTGVVDEGIEGAEGPFDGIDEGRCGLKVGHIMNPPFHTGSVFVRRGLQFVTVASDDENGCAGGSHGPGHAEAESGTAPRDKNAVVIEAKR